jgi:myo-inositol 2-dehydrogenase/D-chiro-inositol 1-dehydrogenase
MRFVQIGTGRMGSLHARVLAQTLPAGDLALADLDSQRAREVASEVGAEAIEVEDAVAAADALVIVTSSAAHPELIRAGLARRVPIFCEKPLALDLAETARLAEEIERAGIGFQLGFQRRFDAAYLEARRRVESGALGVVTLIRLVANDHVPPPESYVPTSGGIFRDSSIHDFDAVRWLTGSEVESVYADGETRGFEMLARHHDLGTVAIVLRLRNGVLAVLGGGRRNPRGYDIRMEVIGSDDAVVVGWSGRTPLEPLDPGVPQPAIGWDNFLDRFEGAYRHELQSFVRVARGEAASACTAWDGLEAMRIAEAATRSAAQRRPVSLEEIEYAHEEKEVEKVPRP